MPNRKQFKTQENYLNWYRKYRKKNRKKVRKYNREYNKEYRQANGFDNETNWAENNPEKVKAKRLVQYAVRCGYLKKKPCEKCGKRKAVAHHDDYSKPLKVRWLCALCHKKYHLRKKRRENKKKVIHF